MRTLGRFPWFLVVALALGTALVTSGCIGSISQDDFDAKMADRGGGLRAGLVNDAIAAIKDRQHATTVRAVAMHIDSRTQTVVIEARDPNALDEVDRYTWKRPHLSVAPVTVSASRDLDLEEFDPGWVRGLQHLPQLEADALAKVGLKTGETVSVDLTRTGEQPTIELTLTSDHGSAVASFYANGDLIEATRR